jgi:hypothetical protein
VHQEGGLAALSFIWRQDMFEVRAIASFDHHGNRSVGDRFTVGSERQAEELVEKGLVERLDSAPLTDSTAGESGGAGPTIDVVTVALGAQTGTNGETTDISTGGNQSSPTPGEQLVGGNATDVIASLAELKDKAVLQSALDAEKAGKDRKTVVEALEAALKAD